MAFITGTVNSLAELRQALINGCTANGWTLTGTVLSKGTCFVDLPTAGADYLLIIGGTGVAGGLLVNPGPNTPAIYNRSTMAFAWPATYRIHAIANEVYLLLRYSVDNYQWVAFGQSPTAGLPGTGNWYGGSFAPGAGWPIKITPEDGGGFSGSGGASSSALFWQNRGWAGATCTNSYVHHGLGEAPGGWSGMIPISTDKNAADAIAPLSPLMSRQPNAGNSEAILLPIRPVVPMQENKVAAVAEMAASRFIRIDNYAPEQIISLGADRWCVYPWMRKNAAARDGGSGIYHSGTLGWAIRYDGP